MTEHDFTSWRNIGPVVSGQLQRAGVTRAEFESLTPEDLFWRVWETYEEPYVALKKLQPALWCRAVWGAQRDVAWLAVPAEVCERFRKFGRAVKKSLG